MWKKRKEEKIMEDIMKECEVFKAYADQITDLMVDSYKWSRLSCVTEDTMTKDRMRHVADELDSLYTSEMEHLMRTFKRS